jgi:Holliday junction resolvasome RuvABC endonuclease subunit
VRVLALDLAIGTTGWAVLEPGPALLAYGLFKLPVRRTTKESRTAWNARRFEAMHGHIVALRRNHQPTLTAYEYPDKPRSVWGGGSKGREFHAMAGLGLAEGFLTAFHATNHLDLRAVSTSEAKYIATGLRDAMKDRVRMDMARIFEGVELMTEDEVDALAVGLAALHDPTGETWQLMDSLIKKTPRATRFGVQRVMRRGRGRRAA